MIAARSLQVKMTTPNLETKVANRSDREVVLKLSNAGVNFKLSTIPKDTFAMIKCEENGTYRECLVAEVNVEAGNPIVITSDDCLEFKELIIKSGREVPRT